MDQPQEAPQAPESGITINDIYSATQIIDAATRRGAFGAGEAGKVGVVYERLMTFLQQNSPHLFEEAAAQPEQEEK